MTLGLFMTLGAALTGLVAAVAAVAGLRKLPSRTEPGYDETIAGRALGYRLTIAAGAALPLLAYAAINLAAPDLAAMELL